MSGLPREAINDQGLTAAILLCSVGPSDPGTTAHFVPPPPCEGGLPTATAYCYCPLPTAYCLLPTAYCLLPTAYFVPPKP